MPREIVLVSAGRLELDELLAVAARVDARLTPRLVLGGWAVQLVDTDGTAVLTVEQSRPLSRDDDVRRILGEDALPGGAWWTEATAPWGRAGERGVRIAYALAELTGADIEVAEGG